MPVPDFFTGDAFNAVSLTKGINKIPNLYGRVGQMGIFRPEGVRTRTIAIDELNGVLNLLPTLPVGSPGTAAKHDGRSARSFIIPHIPHDDVILPADSQDLRAFGTENMLEAQNDLVAQRMLRMRQKHAITLEFMRMGALKGILIDGNGITKYNFYTEFSISPKAVGFALTTATTNVMGKCLEVKRHIEDNLKGEVMSGVYCLCSSGFYDALTQHDKVAEAFKYYQTAQKLSGDYRTNFVYAGITFEEYRGTATDGSGNVRPFIAANEAHFFPLGTMESFVTYFAPADFNEAVNTLGLELYAKMEARPMGRGWDLHTQSNPLPICLRPELLVRATTTTV